jgi:hypothetical protein
MECGSNKVERNGLCATCNFNARKSERLKLKPKPVKRAPAKQSINKVSAVKMAEDALYLKFKKQWIKGKKCEVNPSVYSSYHLLVREAEDIHHMLGRVGYADDWAREHDIPLLLDARFWLPVCREAHIWITEHSAEAIRLGYSLPRNGKID